MSICIKRVRDWLDRRPKAKQWVWFIVLWFGGLLAVLSFAYPIKWIIRAM